MLVYARPDVYDMEYEGAGNYDARFFACLLEPVHPRRVPELACGSGRVTFTLAAADVRLFCDRFDHGGVAERLVTNFANHVYFPAELELLFLSAGFEIEQQYGDYRFVPVDRASPYVVTVAHRPLPS